MFLRALNQKKRATQKVNKNKFKKDTNFSLPHPLHHLRYFITEPPRIATSEKGQYTKRCCIESNEPLFRKGNQI